MFEKKMILLVGAAVTGAYFLFGQDSETVEETAKIAPAVKPAKKEIKKEAKKPLTDDANESITES